VKTAGHESVRPPNDTLTYSARQLPPPPLSARQTGTPSQETAQMEGRLGRAVKRRENRAFKRRASASQLIALETP